MSVVQAYFKTQSQAALCAARLDLDVEPRMVAPYMSRTWMIEIPDQPGVDLYTGATHFDTVLSVVDFFNGIARTGPDLTGHFGG